MSESLLYFTKNFKYFPSLPISTPLKLMTKLVTPASNILTPVSPADKVELESMYVRVFTIPNYL